MKEVKNLEQLQNVVDENEKVLVKVGNEFCGPCRITEMNIDALSADFKDVTYTKVDTDECDEKLLESFGVTSIPIIIGYTKGNLVFKETGLKTKEALKELLEKL